MIDSSTIDPVVSQEMFKLAKEKGSEYIDAPVSGGNEMHCFHYISNSYSMGMSALSDDLQPTPLLLGPHVTVLIS